MTLQDASLTLIGSALLLGSAALLAASLRFRSTISFLLAAYVAANVILVATATALSPWHILDRWTFLTVLGGTFGLSLAVWSRRGRPVPPWRSAVSTARDCLRDRVVTFLAALVAVGFSYVVALAVLTPENEGDALAYHVARAAFWKQQRAVEYIPNVLETRLNVNPPNSEIANLFTMLVSGSDRFVGLVQVGALLACMVAIVGIARRIGLPPREALFGSLLFFTLPVVTMQAPTALNDLSVAAFLVIAVYFVIERSGVDVVLSGLALGLAVGTKFTAALSLPLVVAVVVASPRPGKLKALVGMLAVAVLGGYWFAVNLRETGAADGGLAEAADQHASRAPGAVLATVHRFLLGLLDASGAPASTWRWFVLAGLIAAVAAALSRRPDESLRPALLATLLIMGAPALVVGAYRLLWGIREEPLLRSIPTFTAGATPSWFGPLGALLAVAGVVIAIRQTRRRAASLLTVLLAAMPVAFIVVLALSITWDPWRGRFFIFPFALAAASWGLVLRSRPFTTAVVGIAATTAVLVLANAQAKPSGLGILAGPTASGVWGEPRWRVQVVLRPDEDEQYVLRFVEEHVPGRASIALAPRGNEFVSPYFGARLGRHVDLVLDGQPILGRPDWLVRAPGVRPRVCPDAWQDRLRTRSGWLVSQRTEPPVTCSSN